MNRKSVDSLAQELRVSEDLAHMALSEAQGELEKARAILKDLLPRYLTVKVRYLAVKGDGGGGLIFLCMEKDSPEMLIFDTIVESDRAWVKSTRVHWSSDLFYRLFRDYFHENTTGSKVFDAQRLRQALSARISPAQLMPLFELWDQPKREIIPEARMVEEPTHPGSILHSLFAAALGDALVEKVVVDLDYDFYSNQQFEVIRRSLGLIPPKPKQAAPAAVEERERFKLFLKGQFVIDPVNGVAVSDLEIGDSAYCDILDRSEVSLSAARLIGAYKRGLWMPVRGRVVEINRAIGERRRIRLKLAPGIYLDVLSFDSLLVRVNELTPKERLMKAEEGPHEDGPLPLLIAVVLVAVLILALLILR
jgi:hypothetical protein